MRRPKFIQLEFNYTAIGNADIRLALFEKLCEEIDIPLRVREYTAE